MWNCHVTGKLLIEISKFSWEEQRILQWGRSDTLVQKNLTWFLSHGGQRWCSWIGPRSCICSHYYSKKSHDDYILYNNMASHTLQNLNLIYPKRIPRYLHSWNPSHCFSMVCYVYSAFVFYYFFGQALQLTPPAVEAQNLNQWIARKVPHLHNIKHLFLYKLQVYTISLK